MSQPIEDVIQSTEKILVIQIGILNCLLEKKKFSTLNSYLKLTLDTLLAGKDIDDDMPIAKYLNLAEQEKLAEFCIQVIDNKKSSDGQARIYAMRILSFLVKQLSDEPNSGTILKMIFVSLVKILQPPENRNTSDDDNLIGDDVKFKGLTVRCLDQINLKHILSPVEAHNLIEGSILPLAAWYLDVETKDEKSFLNRRFRDDQFCRPLDDDDVDDLPFDQESRCSSDLVMRLFGNKPLCSYHIVLHLLAALTEHSESGPSGGYRKVLDSMLAGAIKTTGMIKNEHIVAFWLIIQEDMNNLRLTSEHLKVAIGLLKKSEGRHRVYVAQMTHTILIMCKLLHDLGTFGWFSSDNHTTIFTRMMIDDIVTKNDELSVKAAIQFLWEQHGDDSDWRMFVKGKEIKIFRKLVEVNPRPAVYSMFLRHFDCFEDTQASTEFDEMARIPISQNINKLDHLIRLEERDKEQADQLEECLNCLANLLRLRRHRLEPAEELKLIEFFDLLIDIEPIARLSPDPANLLFFANSYQVHHSSVWKIMIKLLRQGEQFTIIGNSIATHRLLSHFIMIDTDYFYSEICSSEVLELIMDYCDLVNVSEIRETLFKELFLTWPKDFRKTKFSSGEHRQVLCLFTQLLVLAHRIAYPRITKYPSLLNPHQAAEMDQYVDLCSGLVAVFSCHREETLLTLNNMSSRQEGRDLWLIHTISLWARLIINHKDASYAGLSERFTPVELASVVVAYEGLMMINREERFRESPKLKESPKALTEFIKLSCDKGSQRAPVDSIMSKRYQQIKASLPAA